MDVALTQRPFLILRERITALFIPFIPILFLLGVFVFQFGAFDPHTLLNATDYYLGGNIHLSSSDLLMYDTFGANALMPIIRLGTVAERTKITDFIEHFPSSYPFDFEFVNFFIVFATLFLGFLSYAMVSRVVYALRNDLPDKFGLRGINHNSIALCLLVTLLVLIVSSFSLVGFRLMMLITFGMYFTLSIPHAALGDPVGESFYKAFKFLANGMGRLIEMYLNCMGIAILAPVGLLIFFIPLLLNLQVAFITDILKMMLGLFSVVFALFFQQALCSSAIYDFREEFDRRAKRREV